MLLHLACVVSGIGVAWRWRGREGRLTGRPLAAWHLHFAISTSVDLMTAVTVSPALRPMCSADPRVMAETISRLPTVTTTSAMTSPSLTDLTVPLNWLRALSMMTLGYGPRDRR